MPYYPNKAHTLLYVIAALMDGPKTTEELCRLIMVNRKTIQTHVHTLYSLGMVTYRKGTPNGSARNPVGRRPTVYVWIYDPGKAAIKMPCELHKAATRPNPANPPQHEEIEE